jgi:bifunctional ADP-heptose synthase (sugar kinase/adenylyltransferase)
MKTMKSLSSEASEFMKKISRHTTAEKVIEDVRRSLYPLRILVVGDSIIDEYHFVRPLGMPSKSPVIAAQLLDSETHMGGVLAVVGHLAGFCKEIHLLTVLGLHDSREDFINKSLAPNVVSKLFRRPDAPTTVKRRYLSRFQTQKLFETMSFDDRPMLADLDAEVSNYLSGVLDHYDLVVVADFGHGFVSKNMIEILSKARFLALNVQMNTANAGYHVVTRYPRADYVCIDEDELRMAYRDHRHSPIYGMVEKISNEMKCGLVTITRGYRGSLTYERDRGYDETPVLSNEVIDTVGAGDAYLAITSPCALAGFRRDVIGLIGNAVGSLAVKFVGNRQSVTPEMLYTTLHSLFEGVS